MTAALQHTPGWWPPLALILCGLFIAAVAAFAVVRWPLTACRRCKGRGRLYEPQTAERFWRKCPRCDGTGTRLRLGRRVVDLLFSREDDRGDRNP